MKHDILRQRDFDKYRGQSETHPLIHMGMEHLVPFQRKHYELWTQSLHFCSGPNNRFINQQIGGGLDDVGNKNQPATHCRLQKHISKSDGKEITLEDPWKAAYKRQMDLYVWVLMRFDVSDEGYFLYCDGDRFSDYDFGNPKCSMKFKMSLLPYTVDTTWIEL